MPILLSLGGFTTSTPPEHPVVPVRSRGIPPFRSNCVSYPRSHPTSGRISGTSRVSGMSYGTCSALLLEFPYQIRRNPRTTTVKPVPPLVIGGLLSQTMTSPPETTCSQSSAIDSIWRENGREVLPRFNTFRERYRFVSIRGFAARLPDLTLTAAPSKWGSGGPSTAAPLQTDRGKSAAPDEVRNNQTPNNQNAGILKPPTNKHRQDKNKRTKTTGGESPRRCIGVNFPRVITGSGHCLFFYDAFFSPRRKSRSLSHALPPAEGGESE